MTFHPKIDYREFHRSARKLPFDDGRPFAYTDEHRARLEEIAKRYPPEGRRSVILPALYLVQRQIGFEGARPLPRGGLRSLLQPIRSSGKRESACETQRHDQRTLRSVTEPAPSPLCEVPRFLHHFASVVQNIDVASRKIRGGTRIGS